jgi:lipid II:glycine glycyltransferase (peptidoglycan interpeptide bridge formation enzyme)
MVINLTPPDEVILSGFSGRARKYIRTADKKLSISTIDLAKEKTDDMFVLFYAFLKDTANAKRFQIPVYRDMLPIFHTYRKHSYLLFVHEDKTPIAVLWTYEQNKRMHFMQNGMVRRGYELHADYFLTWEAIKMAKKSGCIFFTFDPFESERFPLRIPMSSALIRDFGREKSTEPAGHLFRRLVSGVITYLK